MENNNVSQKFMAFIRHGERGDRLYTDEENDPRLVFPLSKMNEDDPPLSVKGMAQASATGKYLANFLKEINIDLSRILIKVSPFSRTLMTASCIAEELGVKTLQVDSTLHEFLGEQMFEENPFPKIEIYKCKSKQQL